MSERHPWTDPETGRHFSISPSGGMAWCIREDTDGADSALGLNRYAGYLASELDKARADLTRLTTDLDKAYESTRKVIAAQEEIAETVYEPEIARLKQELSDARQAKANALEHVALYERENACANPLR